MGACTYQTRALVLRKTKLGESDLIISMLKPDGSLLKAVAKGARKPQSTFSSRLELYSEVELLCAQGKSLDIVKEARLASLRPKVRQSVEHAAGAACMAELLERISREELETPRLFDASRAALDALENARADQVPLVSAAHLLKAFALAGLRPSFKTCVSCGHGVGASASYVRFSALDGGVLCEACASHAQSTNLPAQTCAWAQCVLTSTFSQILLLDAPLQVGIDLLQLSQTWASTHLGVRLKSIQFLLTAGLF